MLTLQSMTYTKGNDQNGCPIWNKIFENKSKSTIRNNLSLCKHTKTYLIYNFQKYYHRSSGIEI